MQVLLAMVVASLLSLLLPFITQSVVDRGVALGNLGFVRTMLVAQLVIVMGQVRYIVAADRWHLQDMDGTAEIITEPMRLIDQFIQPIRSLLVNR